MTKVLNTEAMRRCDKLAGRRHYNRRLTKTFLDSLDPDGYHVVGTHMEHGTDAGNPSIRALVWFKVQGTDAPQPGVVDLPVEVYNALPTSDDLLERVEG